MSALIEEAVVSDPVLIVSGPEGSLREQFIGIVTLIGRSPDADLCLVSEDVDELHCLMTQTTAGLVAKDCFTRTGVIVNGERVTETLLNDDDEIEIGPYRLRLKLPSTSASASSEGEMQQELIQQMAKRIATLEGKRKDALRRAWTFRTKANGRKRPPSRVGPFPGSEHSKSNAAESELAAERRRTAALEAELQKAKERLTKREEAQEESSVEQELRAEIERLKAAAAERKFRSEDQDAVESLREYEQQLNDFRDQLSKDAEDLQTKEFEVAQRADEIRIAEEQLQSKIADTEKELAGERARVKREQSQLERLTAECRQDLEEMHREAENMERDEKFQKLRSQIRGNRDEKDSAAPLTLSEKIQRFLKGMGG
jgi:pSer/pThr/pTyr-binding forkhead associated (FHA) protein